MTPLILLLLAQSMPDLSTPRPLPEGGTLVVGFLGGWERWDDGNRGVRKLALRLRERGLHAEAISNHNRDLALDLVRGAFPSKHYARVILYGQSFGGAAVVKLARELEALDIPVRLTVQVDSVGRGDGVIPANVAGAANLYQSGRFTFRGERRIRAADPSRTRILGNFRFRSDAKPNTWARRVFGGGHARMEADGAVWAQVECMILEAAGMPGGGKCW